MVNQNPTTLDEDSYAADSGDEYEALETDAAEPDDVRAQADEFEDIDMTRLDDGDENGELAAPLPEADRERLDDLDDSLDNASYRDPEALSADDARRHAVHPNSLEERIEERMDRTPITADDLSAQELIDDADEHPPDVYVA